MTTEVSEPISAIYGNSQQACHETHTQAAQHHQMTVQCLVYSQLIPIVSCVQMLNKQKMLGSCRIMSAALEYNTGRNVFYEM